MRRDGETDGEAGLQGESVIGMYMPDILCYFSGLTGKGVSINSSTAAPGGIIG